MPVHLSPLLEWLGSLPWFHIILVLSLLFIGWHIGSVAGAVYDLRASVEGLREDLERQR
jgi:hypothetical protein